MSTLVRRDCPPIDRAAGCRSKIERMENSAAHHHWGFSLGEIRALPALSAEIGRDACAEVRELAAGHLAEVQAKIADLSAMGTYPGGGRAALRCGWGARTSGS